MDNSLNHQFGLIALHCQKLCSMESTQMTDDGMPSVHTAIKPLTLSNCGMCVLHANKTLCAECGSLNC